jgi:hypothetical protein
VTRPLFGLTLLFAALGPAIGGAVFIPLAMLAEAQTQSAAHIGWIAGLIGHAYALIPAYILGLIPAALTGLTYALYDRFAPPEYPRALFAAVAGGLFAHGLYLWLMWAGATLGVWISADFGDEAASLIYDWSEGEFDVSLYRALIASGAIAGGACAATAGLLGLASLGQH